MLDCFRNLGEGQADIPSLATLRAILHLLEHLPHGRKAKLAGVMPLQGVELMGCDLVALDPGSARHGRCSMFSTKRQATAGGSSMGLHGMIHVASFPNLSIGSQTGL